MLTPQLPPEDAFKIIPCPLQNVNKLLSVNTYCAEIRKFIQEFPDKEVNVDLPSRFARPVRDALVQLIQKVTRPDVDDIIECKGTPDPRIQQLYRDRHVE